MHVSIELNKRSAILHSALELIADHGFHGAPVSAIAKASGVSTGIIYHYFDSKDDLVHALYRQVKAQLGQAVSTGVGQELPWRERLRRIWLNAFYFYIAHPKETAFLEQYENSPYCHLRRDELDPQSQALLAMVEQDIAVGHIKPLPLDALYALTLGVAIALAKRQINGSFSVDDLTLLAIADASCQAVAR
jgi:TetR/AcrR family transcriptional regulator, repressor of fatR-cypB operon